MRLNGPIRVTDNSNFYVANIIWDDTSNVQYHNKIYNITVEPAIQECNSSCVTASQSIELVLATGIKYNVTVITEVCNGQVMSTKSEPLTIQVNGMILSILIYFYVIHILYLHIEYTNAKYWIKVLGDTVCNSKRKKWTLNQRSLRL